MTPFNQIRRLVLGCIGGGGQLRGYRYNTCTRVCIRKLVGSGPANVRRRCAMSILGKWNVIVLFSATREHLQRYWIFIGRYVGVSGRRAALGETSDRRPWLFVAK